MCGITGFYLNRPLNDKDIAFGEKCVDALDHRGPDSKGSWADKKNGIFLGHTRLIVIDLSQDSSQPMRKGDTVLTYNGEIYNYKEIRDRLKSEGVNFDTEGDTEVLLNSWRHWKEKSLDIFDGMYAFAVYRDREFYLVTDPFGEKPLYWIRTKDGIYFSSEPAPLVDAFDLKPELSTEDIYDFLLFGFLPPPKTGYKNLNKMPPATYIKFDPAMQTLISRKYWTPPYPVLQKGPVKPLGEKDLDIIQASLFESLKVRTRSDVPWGIFLSSGIDSSLILSMTIKDLKLFPKSLTVAFPGLDVSDEFAAARDITNYLKAPHFCVNAGDNPMYQEVRAILDLYGDLNYNSTVIAAYQMAREAKNYMKMALSGIGGDEVFYGYRRYWVLYLLQRKADIIPSFIRSITGAVGKKIFSHDSFMRRMTHFFSSKNLERVIYSRVEMAASWLDSYKDFNDNLKDIFDKMEDFYEIGNLSPYELAQKLDLSLIMPMGYIPAIERGSMKTGLEVRTPYLNRKLLNTVSRFDQRSFIAFGRKTVLKRILERYLPKKLFDFPKKGFFTPRTALLKSANLPFGIKNIGSRQIKYIWDRQDKPDWCELAIKLAVIDDFYNGRYKEKIL